MDRDESRRDFLGGIFTSAGKVVTKRIQKLPIAKPPAEHHSDSFLPILRSPDVIRVITESGTETLESLRGGVWLGDGLTVRSHVLSDRHRITLEAPESEPMWIAIRWQGVITCIKRYLGDHWERSYGDAEWRSESPDRPMPWYFLAFDGKRTHGYGVSARPSALCFWTADRSGITLWLDVRNGGKGVVLGDREMELCEIVSREGDTEESPFFAHQEFCRQMCPRPRLAGHSIYGTNDWYHLYGQSSAEQILEISRIVAELSPNVPNRPFSVIDAGWSPGGCDQAPYSHGNERFGDMGSFASQLKDIGVRPGIWIRPLVAGPDFPESWRLSRNRDSLDPTHPEVSEYVYLAARRCVDWGYELVKHDFSTWDLLGRWGSEMGPNPTTPDWTFHDRSRTTAEIINDFYDTLRAGAGSAYLMGCNTLSHLSAGVFEVNRIGDDTSGRDWNRTRKMGVNALAFRAAHEGTFYAADADVAAMTQQHRGRPALEWLRLLGLSGTPLFVSIDPSTLGPDEWSALRDAFAQAASEQPVAEPLDWLTNAVPCRWRIQGDKKTFDWSIPEGSDPFAK